MKTVTLTALALLAFAGNSVLCRLALQENAIDATSFTVLRLLSGSLILALILLTLPKEKGPQARGSWKGAMSLFVYAATFSYAYVSLETGMGALILFGVVQITMILSTMLRGRKVLRSEWVGTLVAFAGLVYLVLPSLATPSFIGFILMTISGIAWAIYTLVGKDSKNPIQDTAYNFLRTLPLLVPLIILMTYEATISQEGMILAILSGGLTSAIGYTIWYFSLKGLSAIQASVAQLLVPIIAAIGGVIFAQEYLSLRLLLSTAFILGGVVIVIKAKP